MFEWFYRYLFSLPDRQKEKFLDTEVSKVSNEVWEIRDDKVPKPSLLITVTCMMLSRPAAGAQDRGKGKSEALMQFYILHLWSY